MGGPGAHVASVGGGSFLQNASELFNGDRGKSKMQIERAANTLDARLLMKLDEFTVNSNEKNIANTVLVIDGKILTILLKPENVKAFIEVAIQAPAIVCCRCTPTQKADIVQAIRKYGGEDKCKHDKAVERWHWHSRQGRTASEFSCGFFSGKLLCFKTIAPVARA